MKKLYKVVSVRHKYAGFNSRKSEELTEQEIQRVLDEYSQEGYRLVTANTIQKSYNYTYLYFER